MREFTGALVSDATEAPWPLDLREGGRLDDGGVDDALWALWISRLGEECDCVYWRMGDGREDDNAVGWGGGAVCRAADDMLPRCYA